MIKLSAINTRQIRELLWQKRQKELRPCNDGDHERTPEAGEIPAFGDPVDHFPVL
jgi:hypothetical protein